MRNKKTYQKPKKYAVIVKVDAEKFCKWRCNNLLKLVVFLDSKWSDWRYFNVYDNKTKQQIGNYTNKNRPTTPFI